METKILSKRINPVLNREEVDVQVTHKLQSTPKRADLLKEFSKLLGSKEDLIIIDKMSTSTGKTETLARTLVYKKKEDIPSSKLKRMSKKLPQKAPTQEKPKEVAETVKPEEKAE